MHSVRCHYRSAYLSEEGEGNIQGVVSRGDFQLQISVRERNASAKAELSVEKSLLISCAANTLIFVLGQVHEVYECLISSDVQVLVTYAVTSRKWMLWSIMFVFTWNSLLSAVVLFTTSSVLRDKVLTLLHVRKVKRLLNNDDDCSLQIAESSTSKTSI